jgi:hypothetical protein
MAWPMERPFYPEKVRQAVLGSKEEPDNWQRER